MVLSFPQFSSTVPEVTLAGKMRQIFLKSLSKLACFSREFEASELEMLGDCVFVLLIRIQMLEDRCHVIL